jgi:sec-independent protein translocase protein TatA
MNIGALEIILLILVVFILFGAGKLPSVMSDLGKGIKSFRKGMEEEDQDTIKSDSQVDGDVSDSGQDTPQL